jgi:hypothetical protein
MLQMLAFDPTHRLSADAALKIMARSALHVPVSALHVPVSALHVPAAHTQRAACVMCDV